LINEIAYLTKQNPLAARRVARLFDSARQRIARHPLIGPKGDLADTRIVVVGPYIVTLKVRDGEVEIGAIRHGRQADARAPTNLTTADDPDPT
jgi:plasmid stabilization system protein ParE